jgi:Family of unknown function (DUF5309)
VQFDRGAAQDRHQGGVERRRQAQPAADGFDPEAELLGLRRHRKWKKESLAQTGDARKFHIVGEATLGSRNDAGSGIVADLT